MADSVGVPCSLPWLVVPEADTWVDGTQAVAAWPMGARPVGRGGSAAVADIAVAVADMAAAAGHSVVGLLIGWWGLVLRWCSVLATLIVSWPSAASATRRVVVLGWGCRGS